MIYTIILFLIIIFFIHKIRMRLIELLKKGKIEEALHTLEMTEIKSN